MNKSHLKIIIPVAIVVILLISFIFYLLFSPSKYIEISSNSDVKISLNRFNKVVDIEGIDDNGQNVVSNLANNPKTLQDVVNAIIETSINLYPLDEDSSIDVLFVSKDLQKDKTLIGDLSTELSLIASELNITAPINQYKLTTKDYGVINEIKKTTGYRTFDILQQGFVSKEEVPYITSIIYKSDCYFINFSDDIIFNGQEEIICKNGDSIYETQPAGYSKSTMALFINEPPAGTSLSFDVSIKDHENLFGYCITENANANNQSDVDVTYSLDYDKNLAKLTDLKQQIIEADITEHDRYDLLNKYDMLSNTIDRIATSEDLADFNTMCDDLQKDIDKAIETNKNNEQAQESTNSSSSGNSSNNNSSSSSNNSSSSSGGSSSSNSNTTPTTPTEPVTPPTTDPDTTVTDPEQPVTDPNTPDTNTETGTETPTTTDPGTTVTDPEQPVTQPPTDTGESQEVTDPVVTTPAPDTTVTTPEQPVTETPVTTN